MSNRDPITAAAPRLLLAVGSRRSMRAAMAACRVAGTLTSATSANADISRRGRRRVRRRSARSRTISSAKKGFPEARSAMVIVRSPTDESTPSNSVISAVVSESLSGAREIVCASAARASAPW